MLAAPAAAFAQLGTFSNEQRLAVTAGWTGERFPDGRPKVADGILQRMEAVTAEEAWGVLTEAGYRQQFEGGWKEINAGAQGRRLVGRVVTAVFMPMRPDLNDAINKAGAAEKRVGRGQNSWVIDTFSPATCSSSTSTGRSTRAPSSATTSARRSSRRPARASS